MVNLYSVIDVSHAGVSEKPAPLTGEQLAEIYSKFKAIHSLPPSYGEQFITWLKEKWRR